MQASRIMGIVVSLIICSGQAAAAEQVPVEAFANFNKVHSPRISPDGQHFAVAAELGEGNHALVIYRIQDMQQTMMLRLPRYELPAQMYWVSSKRLVIAKARQVGSREQPAPMGEIIATDFDGKNQKYIFGYERSTRIAGVSRGFGYIEGLPEERNGHFYMRRLSFDTHSSQLYDIDSERTTGRLIADIPIKDLSFVLDRKGVPRFAYGNDDNANYLLYAADANGENWKQVASSQVGGKFVPFAFSADGQQLFAYLSEDDGPSMLVKSDLAGQNRIVLAKDEFGSVGDVEWTATPSEPFAAILGEGKPRMAYFDEKSPEAQLHQALSKSFPDKYVTYANHSSNGNISLFYAYSDRDPGAWYLFDRKQSKVSKILINREGIDAARMGERRPFRFKASDGLELSGFMTLPAGIQQPSGLPMVLVPHGGPHAPGDDWSFDTDAQFLASRGYLVLQVNFRGSQGRGYRFERAGYLKWGTRIQDDLLDGVRWAIAQGYANPDRICSYGASFGGYSALMTAARAPELIKCAVGSMGVYDLKMMYSKGDIKSTAFGRNYLARVIGRDDSELVANSPVSLAARIQAPVLLIHGEADERVPFAQSKAMKAALERAGHPPEWMAVPGEGHGFYKDENNVAYYRRLEAFIGKYIGAASQQ